MCCPYLLRTQYMMNSCMKTVVDRNSMKIEDLSLGIYFSNKIITFRFMKKEAAVKKKFIIYI